MHPDKNNTPAKKEKNLLQEGLVQKSNLHDLAGKAEDAMQPVYKHENQTEDVGYRITDKPTIEG